MRQAGKVHFLDSVRQYSLRLRLVAILAASLMPILVISAIQAYFDARTGQELRRNELVLATDRSMDRVGESLESAERFLAVFAEDISHGDCVMVSQRISSQLPSLTNVFFTAQNGEVVCSVDDHTALAPLEFTPALDGDNVRTRFLHRQQTDDPAGFVLRTPVLDSDGTVFGSAGFILGIDAVLRQLAVPALPEDVEIVLANRRGDIFGATNLGAIDSAWITEASQIQSGLLVRTKNRDGVPIDLVLKRVLTDEVFALISTPSPTLLSEASLRPARSFGLPLLVFSVALLSAWLAVDHLALRWLSRLRNTARRYGEGNYSARAGTVFEKSPEEIAALAETFDAMAAKISERDEELTASLRLQEDLVREVHHRVKNNLQIITSSLNLQSRQLRDPAGREALAAARHRIDALSIVHNTLYQHDRLKTVDAKPFLEGLLQHLKDALAMEESEISLTVDILETGLEADAAIPIALFIVEAVTNSVKYAFNANGGDIKVLLTTESESLFLMISDNGLGDDTSSEDAIGTGLGSRFMLAFARQLRGEMKVRNRRGEGYRVELRFPDPSQIS